MTPSDLRAALDTLGWTIRGLARQLGRPEHSVLNWSKPQYRVPADVAAWILRRVERHRRDMRDDPPPR